MQITRKNLPKAQVELIIEVSSEDTKPYIQKAADAISHHVNIAGFRKGKVPYEILKKNVGEAAIFEEVFKRVVEKTLPEALEKEKIEIVGQPNIEPQKIAPGNPIIYKATLSLYPEIKLGAYIGLKAKKESVEVKDSEVEKSINELRKLRASETVVNREAKKGDKVLLDFDVLLAGVVIENGSYKKQQIEIGTSNFIPGFEDQLIGVKKGDAKEFKLTFPKEYHEKNLAGKEATFKLNVHDVYEVILPALDDAWAKSLGMFETVQALKDAIKENMKREAEAKELQKFEVKLLEEVMKNSTFGDMPEILIESEVDKMFHELEHEITKNGGKFEDYLQSMKKDKDQLKKDFVPQAEKRVKSALLIREIALKEKIFTTEDEVEKELDSLKAYYEKIQPEVIKNISTPEYRRYTGNILNNQKVIKFLVEKNSK